MNKENLILGLLESAEQKEVCFQIRKRILDNEELIPDENYEMACYVFEQTAKAYFKLGFEASQVLLLNPCNGQQPHS